MKTTFTVYRVGQEPLLQQVDLAEKPDFDELRAIIQPLLDGAHLERVRVLHNGEALDMFVDEEGMLRCLPVNPAASAIYRNNWLTKHPGTDPQTLPPIYGTAVLFHRRVWF